MAIRLNTGLGGRVSGAPASGMDSGDSTGRVQFGRVVDVIVDMSHERVRSLGGTQALYGVFYQPLFEAVAEDIPDYGSRFAYCGQQTFRQIPVRGEIVKLEQEVAGSTSEADYGSNGNVFRTYWTSIVPIWNNPHLNFYPDTLSGDEISLGPGFEEQASIRPLQLNPGDITLEGRHGQSIRLGGTVSDNSPFTSKESNGKPYIILRNGQKATQGDTVYEDVNEDDTSLYLTSDHQVPITEANRKFKAALKAPELAGKFKGKQFVGNSDRVILNAKEDNMILAAKKHFSVNADSVSVDGEQYVGLDAPKIYLGSNAQKEREPNVKGATLQDKLESLAQMFADACTILSKPGSTAWEAAAATQFAFLKTSLSVWKSGVPQIKSTKVFTE